jgi:hypothetical protein
VSGQPRPAHGVGWPDGVPRREGVLVVGEQRVAVERHGVLDVVLAPVATAAGAAEHAPGGSGGPVGRDEVTSSNDAAPTDVGNGCRHSSGAVDGGGDVIRAGIAAAPGEQDGGGERADVDRAVMV